MSARAIFLISAFYHDLEYSQAIIGTILSPAAPELPAAAQEWTF